MATNPEQRGSDAAKMAVLTNMCASLGEATRMLVENNHTLKRLLEVCEDEHVQAKKRRTLAEPRHDIFEKGMQIILDFLAALTDKTTFMEQR